MGLYFFVGIIIYLFILFTLMIWFLNHHSSNDRGGAKPINTDQYNQDEKDNDDSSVRPNHISVNCFQEGAQSRTELKRGVARIL